MFAAAIKRQQEHYYSLFLQAGASSPESAVHPESIGIPKNQALRNMIWRGRIAKLENGCCYILK